MFLQRKPPDLVDPHLFADIAREDDARRQAETRPPRHEVIEWHLTYLAEAYLPSQAAQLAEGLARQGWEETRTTARDLVPAMRATAFGGGWTRLGILVPDAEFAWGGIRVASVPDRVASVRLALWSVTPSLTVLVAAFEWDDDGAAALDRIAKTDFPTAIIPSRGGRTIYDPYLQKRLEARRLRRARHDALAAWLVERVPGAFTDLGSRLPTLDVMTTAQAKPFAGEPPLSMCDFREALDLEGVLDVATSSSLPGWKLALRHREMPNVLTLGARTVDVFDESLLGRYGGGVSRWGLANYLTHRVDDLLCSWAAAQLLTELRTDLATTRDRAPAADESSASFARRLSRDVNTALRRGADSSAYCADILARPKAAGPLRVVQTIDFVAVSPWRRRPLRDVWIEWMIGEAKLIRRAERDQLQRLSTSAQLTGVVVSVRTQDQMRFLTIATVVFAIAAVVLAVLQLVSS